MLYVNVSVADESYHGSDSLTYVTTEDLGIGALVEVPLKTKKVFGIVVGKTTKRPTFPVKSIVGSLDLPPVPQQTIELMTWMQAYYASNLGSTCQLFIPRKIPTKPLPTTLYDAPNSAALSPLTTDQTQAVGLMKPDGLHILHGATGSGKTRVYIEKTLVSIKQKKSVIILTPEIGLTSQLVETFTATFGDRVALLHSQLTSAVRQQTWQRILSASEPLIVIGTRSALFSPIKNVGLIVIDEAHENAYKQDKTPCYHAVHVGAKLAALHGCPIILGSATPSIVDYYYAEQKRRPIIRMQQIATQHSTDEKRIIVIDLKDKNQFTKKTYLSDQLIDAIKATLLQREQVLLFLNRRGTARIILCDVCGWQANCPHCDIPIIYHNDSHSLRCHSCNFTAIPPVCCPECSNASILFKSIGTKAIFEEVVKLFPQARVQRFDTDNKKNERFEQHYQMAKSGQIDILVGTQTLAKGLDLPHLSLVGIIIADTSLYVPDFSAQERTYQTLSQVIGRVGRGHTAGTVFVQTYSPQNSLFTTIATDDWHTFYEAEKQERKQFLFPPFCYLLKIWGRRATQKGIQNAAEKLANNLHNLKLSVVIEGPAPAFQEKVQNQYEWQLIVKAKRRSDLIQVIHALPANWRYDIDPMNLL